ncbi:hypothetical protein [Oceanobacillus kapialis]|uniref:Uncharacterized protein n=1 Tax=Oceanobacillus kapialis TaxID=481353 RepID=A0ABW5Q543_9BACI
MTALLPIILLTVLMIGVIMLVRFSAKSFPALRRKERWLLPLYVSILIACGIILAIVQPFEERLASSGEEKPSSPSLYSYMDEGNPEDIDEAFVREGWDFTYSGEELHIISSPSEELMAPIYVEKVAGMGDAVEVIYYETPLYMDGEDMSEYINPPAVTLSGDGLHIISPDGYEEVELNTFKDPFPFNQFTGRTFMGSENESTVQHGENVVLIRVGEDQTLDLNPDSYINYVR